MARLPSAMAGALCTLVLLLAAIPAARAYSGDATAYSGPGDKDATGRNACGFGHIGSYFEKFYGALPPSEFDGGAACGRCVRARGRERGASGDWHLIKIVDMCASCASGDLDMSTTAFKAVTGYEWDRKGVEWQWTSCDSSSDGGGKRGSDDGDGESEEERPAKKGSKKERTEEEEEEEEQDQYQSYSQKADEEAEAAAAQAAAEASAERKRQRAAAEGQGGQAPAAPPPTTATTTSSSPATAALGVSTDPEAKWSSERNLTDWVVACQPSRSRCPSLALAARGYQCATAAQDKCCLQGNGKNCRPLEEAEGQQAPAWWRGRDLLATAGAAAPTTPVAPTATQTASIAEGPAAGPAPAPVDDVTAAASRKLLLRR